MSPECGLVETHWSGPIPDTLLLARGFNIGCNVTEKGGYAWVTEACVGDNVTPMQNDDTKTDITKGELRSQWHVATEEKRESYDMKDLPDPTNKNDLQADIWHQKWRDPIGVVRPLQRDGCRRCAVCSLSTGLC